MKQTRYTLKKYFFLLTLISVGCSADLTSKQWAQATLKDNVSIEVIPKLFDFTYVENEAVSFGLLRQIPENIRLPLIFTLTISAVVFMLFLLWLRRKSKPLELMPIALITSGASGNILDRFNNGYVVDFIHFHFQYDYSFPVFNIADVLVFCGVCLLLYQNWKKQQAYLQ